MAFKVKVGDGVNLTLDPAWISGNFSAPEPVVVVDGVVLAPLQWREYPTIKGRGNHL